MKDPSRAELINNLSEIQAELRGDIEKIEYYRERLKDGDDLEDVTREFLDDEFFIQ